MMAGDADKPVTGDLLERVIACRVTE